MGDILVGLSGSKAKYEKGHKRISWSKFSDYSSCPRGWFLKHFADVPRGDYFRDATLSLPGTLIQRVFEVYFKAQKYAAVGLGSVTASSDWMGCQVSALFDFLVFDFSERGNYPADTRGFFVNVWDGVERSKEMQGLGVLDIEFYVDAEPVFIDFGKLKSRWGGVNEFKEYVRDCLGRSLVHLRGIGVPFSKIQSEVFVSEVFLGDFEIAGSLDFVVNAGDKRRGIFFTDFKELRDGFLVWDGKLNVNSWVDSRQLYFYAYLLYLKYRKKPDGVAFFDWTKGSLCEVPLCSDLEELLLVKEDLRVMVEESHRLSLHLSKLKAKFGVISIQSIPAVPKPSESACNFCPFKSGCDVSFVGSVGVAADLDV